MNRLVVIYGPNGSGKTSLSRVFADLEDLQESKITPHRDAKLTLRADPGELSVHLSKELPADSPPVRVYSTKRVEEYLGVIGGGKLPINLVLGKGAPKLEAELDDVEQNIKDVRAMSKTLDSQVSEAVATIDKAATDVGRTICQDLPGIEPYQRYNKSHVWAFWKNIADDPAQVDDGDLEKLRQQATEPQKDKISLAETEPVIRKAMSEIQRLSPPNSPGPETPPAVRLWISRGMEIHKGHGSPETCLYCTSAISESRQNALAAIAGDHVAAFRAEVSELRARIATVRDAVQAQVLPDSKHVYPSVREEYSVVIDAHEKDRKRVITFLDALLETLDRLVNLEPQGNVPSVDDALQPWSASKSDLATIVNEHNTLVDDHGAQVAAAAKKCAEGRMTNKWASLSSTLQEWVLRRGELETHNIELGILENRKVELEDQRVDAKISAEQLTRDLRAYFGRDEFSVKQSKDSPNHYELLRHGKPAKGLSDGERRAISFVYFLESLNHKDFDKARGVIVIDDPVNSMDEGALYQAHAFLYGKAKGVAQSIVLTHNFGFFRLLKRDAQRKFKPKIAGQKQELDSNLLMLEAAGNPKKATLRPLPSLLRDYASEYHYLYYKVWEVEQLESLAQDKRTSDHEEMFMAIANHARRMLEAFGSFQYPGDSGQSAGAALNEMVNQIKRDHESAGDPTPTAEQVAAAEAAGGLVALLNAGSHQAGVGFHEPDPAIVHEAPRHMANLLSMMRYVAPTHCKQLDRKCNGIGEGLWLNETAV